MNFEKFIFRCPVFSMNNTPYQNISPVEQEAIFLASPELFSDFLFYEEGLSPKKELKKELTLLKYQIRMRSRCTPFGLFAGCGIGSITDKSEILLDSDKSFKTYTRLDMDFLCSLLASLTRINCVREKLLFYPNSSLYKIMNSFRYVEYNYLNGQRKHTLSEIETDNYLEKVFSTCERGCLYPNIIDVLKNDENLNEENIKEYVDDLIENQILVSNLYPTLTGEDLLTSIINILDQFDVTHEKKQILVRIKRQLENIDKQKIGRDLMLYKAIENDVKMLDAEYQKRYLFQSDTFIQPLFATIDTKIIETIKEGIKVLNKLTPKFENKILTEFITEFHKRYEEEEIPLIEALDPDIGIGFSNLKPGNIDFHPLVDDIHKDEKENDNKIIEFLPFELLILKEFHACLESGHNIITLTDELLKEVSFESDDIPFTFSTVIELINPGTEEELPLILFKSSAGPSAANLISRFCHLDEEIKKHVSSIIQKENELAGPDKIIAEIVHLPESRTGNILFRPVLRDFEIPYLAKESVTEECKIPITDLLVSVKGGKTIKLRSKKLNKEIIPRHTTAHNFYTNSLPLYHFLCAFQTFGLKEAFFFGWSPHFTSKKFLPRIMYKNMIFSLATWNFRKEEVSHIHSTSDINFLNLVKEFKRENNLPDLVSLVNGDNKLFIDFKQDQLVRLLFNEIKNKNFVLEEFIDYSDIAFTRCDNNEYRNEIIISFYKK